MEIMGKSNMKDGSRFLGFTSEGRFGEGSNFVCLKFDDSGKAKVVRRITGFFESLDQNVLKQLDDNLPSLTSDAILGLDEAMTYSD